MIEDINPYQSADLNQASGDIDIFLTGSRIAARMIMNQNHGGGAAFYRPRKTSLG
jgi:hypothetical protein